MIASTAPEIASSTLADVLLAALRWEALLDLAATCRPPASPDVLHQRWRAARARMHELAEREAGCADNAALLPLPPQMAEHVDRLVASPILAEAFPRVPVAFGLAEIDALVTLRPLLWRDTLAAYREAAGPATSDDRRLAEFALPLAPRPGAPRCRLDGQRWQVVGEDEALALTTLSATIDESGRARLELMVASPPPLMHVARLHGRLLLIDGAHRARALKARGVTYAPCLVSACDDIDDLRTLCPWVPAEELARVVESPRPVMLRDHDRRSLVMQLPAARRQRLLTFDLIGSSSWLPT